MKNHIQISQDICGGKPHILGHRIRVQDIAIWHEKLGRSPDEIIQIYPGLSYADIFAALSFYYDNKDQIDREIGEEGEFFEAFKTQHPSKLRTKLEELRVG